MGGGCWTSSSYTDYTSSRGITTNSVGGIDTIDTSYNVQDLYRSKSLNKVLDPKNVMRECCDTEEHPDTIPVVFALDCTGSMGHSAEVTAQKLNVIMTKLYEQVKDVEFMIMGIGDLAYDYAPIQISQFESDIRIAEQLEKVYFEFGGGGNGYESYTAAWYMGSRHTKLDCLKRGRKGIIITLGDEPLNPYLPKGALMRATGDDLQADIETKDLYEETSEKFNIYHIAVETRTRDHYEGQIRTSYGKYLDDKHLIFASCDDLVDTVIKIITDEANNQEESFVETSSANVSVNELNEISW